MTPAERIRAALNELHDAYWDACDQEGRAVDPNQLAGVEIPELAEAYEIALRVEGVAQERRIPWNEARQFV